MDAVCHASILPVRPSRLFDSLSAVPAHAVDDRRRLHYRFLSGQWIAQEHLSESRLQVGIQSLMVDRPVEDAAFWWGGLSLPLWNRNRVILRGRSFRPVMFAARPAATSSESQDLSALIVRKISRRFE